MFVKGDGDLRSCGSGEAGAIAFFRTRMKGELTDDQNRAADILDTEIHFALGIAKNAHLGNFPGQPIGILWCIFMLNPQEND